MSEPTVRFLSRDWVSALDACLRDASPLENAPTFSVAHVVADGPEGAVTYVMRVEQGRARATLTAQVEDADVVLHEDYATAAAISRGELSSQQAVAAGRLKLSGDVRALLRLGTAFVAFGAASERLRRNTVY